MDDSWRKCDGSHERLQWARERKFPGDSQASAARKMNATKSTYSALERAPGTSKWIAMDAIKARYYGEKLGVRWEWLLFGDGEPVESTPNGPTSRLRRAMESATPEQQEMIADLVERVLRTGR